MTNIGRRTASQADAKAPVSKSPKRVTKNVTGASAKSPTTGTFKSRAKRPTKVTKVADNSPLGRTVEGRKKASAKGGKVRANARADRSAASGPGAGATNADLLSDVTERATVRHAQERLDRLCELRDAHELAAAGLGQREIAASLHTTQPRVHRMLRVKGVDLQQETPEEVILRATIDRTDRSALIKALAKMNYTFKTYAPGHFDGSVAGTWDQVRAAMAAGLLTRDEYEQIRDAVDPAP